MNYQNGSFHSDHTSAYGGLKGGSGGENGGPGVVYLYGKIPQNKNLRIDNRGRVSKVKNKRSRPYMKLNSSI